MSLPGRGIGWRQDTENVSLFGREKFLDISLTFKNVFSINTDFILITMFLGSILCILNRTILNLDIIQSYGKLNEG